jgi:NADP-dependent aldehyde dehydrogenase
VKHPLVKAVGFTGSYSGGKQLFDWANQRKEPIPVFAEMGSVNPVFVLPGKIKDNEEDFAGQFAESITQSAGQFCTKPGVIAGIDNSSFRLFANKLAEKINQLSSMPMLHPGIHENFLKRKSIVMDQPQTRLLAAGRDNPSEGEATPTLLETDAASFLDCATLHEEVFGPLSIIIYCKDTDELHALIKSFDGQLTATFIASPAELKEHEAIIESAKQLAGRIILNGVPTGVKVCLAMHHGGPFPATTNSHFTSVGGDAIKRFVRPVTFQNWPDELLPPELQNSNPLNIWRTLNNEVTRNPVR